MNIDRKTRLNMQGDGWVNPMKGLELDELILRRLGFPFFSITFFIGVLTFFIFS
jgi:hypothetical protein